MFRFVGFIVVTGFAFYGAGQFFAKHVVAQKPGKPADGTA